MGGKFVSYLFIIISSLKGQSYLKVTTTKKRQLLKMCHLRHRLRLFLFCKIIMFRFQAIKVFVFLTTTWFTKSVTPWWVLVRGYVRLKLSPTSGRCPRWLIFKNLFYQNNCKEAMNIGGGQIRGTLFNIFVVKKWLFLYLLDAALSF